MSKDIPQVFELGILERVQLVSILAHVDRQGDLNTMQVTKQVLLQFIADLSLTETEITEWGVQHEQGGTMVRWTVNGLRTFTFTPWRLSKIHEVLRMLDSKGAVAMNVVSLFEVFGIQPSTTALDPELAAEYAALQAASKDAEEEQEEPTPIFGGEASTGKQDDEAGEEEPTPLHPVGAG